MSITRLVARVCVFRNMLCVGSKRWPITATWRKSCRRRDQNARDERGSRYALVRNAGAFSVILIRSVSKHSAKSSCRCCNRDRPANRLYSSNIVANDHCCSLRRHATTTPVRFVPVLHITRSGRLSLFDITCNASVTISSATGKRPWRSSQFIRS